MAHHHHKRNHRSHHGFNLMGFLKQVTKPVGHIVDDGTKIVTTGIHEVGTSSRALIKSTGGLLDKISMPLIIVGGVVVLVMITTKK